MSIFLLEGVMPDKKKIRVGVKQGDGSPPYQRTVGILDFAYEEAMSCLEERQYDHMALQVKELARHPDPTHSDTIDVKKIEDIYEIRDKGGPLGNINVRVFFGVDKDGSMIILGVAKKQNNGKTPQGDKTRMTRRWRKYLRGDYGRMPHGGGDT